jgi:hypothetical protein
MYDPLLLKEPDLSVPERMYEGKGLPIGMEDPLI